MKKKMRTEMAIYGDEMSAYHYFRDFAYCDSGMIPWLLMAELLSKSGQSLAARVRDRLEAFPSSGEMNFQLEDANRAINSVLSAYQDDSITLDHMDGVSLISSH
jgi:phosphomannomutase